MPRLMVWTFSTVVLMLISGCFSDGVSLAEVTGEVTFNGLPTPAEVVFEPDPEDDQQGGRASTAYTDAEGKFTLLYSGEKSGAVIGRHLVSIKIPGAANNSEPNSFEEQVSALKVVRVLRQVRRGTNHFHFAITY